MSIIICCGVGFLVLCGVRPSTLGILLLLGIKMAGSCSQAFSTGFSPLMVTKVCVYRMCCFLAGGFRPWADLQSCFLHCFSVDNIKHLPMYNIVISVADWFSRILEACTVIDHFGSYLSSWMALESSKAFNYPDELPMLNVC